MLKHLGKESPGFVTPLVSIKVIASNFHQICPLKSICFPRKAQARLGDYNWLPGIDKLWIDKLINSFQLSEGWIRVKDYNLKRLAKLRSCESNWSDFISAMSIHIIDQLLYEFLYFFVEVTNGTALLPEYRIRYFYQLAHHAPPIKASIPKMVAAETSGMAKLSSRHFIMPTSPQAHSVIVATKAPTAPIQKG